MAQKIMIVLGSPRKGGNTRVLADWVAAEAKENGAEIEMVDAARLDYKTNGCTACLGCKEVTPFHCVVKDEASDILARMPSFDLIIFATPIYFMGFTAQIKLLMDRMFSLVKIDPETKTIEHKFENTEFALIANGGGDEGSGINLTRDTIKAIAGFYGKAAKCLMVPFAPYEPGGIANNLEVKDKAIAFAKELL